ncbi:8621_t:CDS:1, partial [Scutellospora calospora]
MSNSLSSSNSITLTENDPRYTIDINKMSNINAPNKQILMHCKGLRYSKRFN